TAAVETSPRPMSIRVWSASASAPTTRLPWLPSSNHSQMSASATRARPSIIRPSSFLTAWRLTEMATRSNRPSLFPPPALVAAHRCPSSARTLAQPAINPTRPLLTCWVGPRALQVCSTCFSSTTEGGRASGLRFFTFLSGLRLACVSSRTEPAQELKENRCTPAHAYGPVTPFTSHKQRDCPPSRISLPPQLSFCAWPWPDRSSHRPF